MKEICFFIGILMSFSNLAAQEKISKQHNTSSIDEVEIDLKFANDIVIKEATNTQVLIEAEVNINNNKDNDYFNLSLEEKSDKLIINSDYGDLFKDNKTTITNSGKNYTINNNTSQVVVNYVLYIPINKKVKLKSISGNVDISKYKGAISLDLISGDISIKNHSKEMNLKTVSGDIDVFVDDANFMAETLTGTIYSNLDIDFNHQKRNGIENKTTGIVKNGSASLKMKTISGNVFLRKI